MTRLELGRDVDVLLVKLTDGSDFAQVLRAEDGYLWPAGTVVELEVGSAVWRAVVDGTDLTFTAAWTDVLAACGSATDVPARLVHHDAGTRVVWASGRARIDG